MRAFRALALAAALTLGVAPCALAQEPFAGSARVTPYLVAAHLQLALNHLRAAEDVLADAGARRALRPDQAALRQSLQEASDELVLARLATADPEQIRALDDMLAEIDRVRDLLRSHAALAPGRMRRLEGAMLALHRTARSQVAMREETLLRAESGRPAVR